MLDLRFYVSNISLISSTGDESSLELATGSGWQHANVAFIDLEDGRGSCLNGTSDINSRVTGLSASSDIVAVRFTIGVPFELNHANPLRAEPPLNDAAMHWHWRSGYKFLRAGVTRSDDGFWLHLGSTGCQGTVGNISACASQNRVSVVLRDFSPATNRIAVDLQQLFANTNLQDGVRGDCSASPAEETCEAPFAALGLDFGTRQAPVQQVFRVYR